MPSPDDQITITISRGMLENLKTLSSALTDMLNGVGQQSDATSAQAEQQLSGGQSQMLQGLQQELDNKPM